MRYRGRFAPSPTGPLHFGSLVAALASYLDARANSGEWLVRMEDVDTPRTVPGAAESILQTLELYGFRWDGPVMQQSARTPAYEAALDSLRRSGAVYPCSCSRRDAGEGVYSGRCRSGVADTTRPAAWRIRVPDNSVEFRDVLLGEYEQNLARDVGDFVVRRSDGLFAYQLAVVVDDATQGITTVVRGSDLLDSTPRQIWLQQLQGYPQPEYLHVPVVTNANGEKLSKQTLAPALDPANAVADLQRALRFLSQPEVVSAGNVAAFLAEAVRNWNRARIQTKATTEPQASAQSRAAIEL